MGKVSAVVKARVDASPLQRRKGRMLALRRVREQLVSVAGIVGSSVRLADGRDVGTLVDVVVRFGEERYPRVAGLVVRIGRRRVFVPGTDLASVTPRGATLVSTVVDLRDFEAREGEVVLMRDVVDHQLVDVDGIQVVRANDLYLSTVNGRVRLVGVEVGPRSLLRRLGPARRRSIAAPERVIDWAAVHSFGTAGAGGTMQLDRSRSDLERLRPGDLARLLEELGRPQRQELLAALRDEVAADALEEMDEQERDQLLRETTVERAAAIIAAMEPDEAVEALRDLGDDDASEVVASLPPAVRERLDGLLALAPDVAGGIMTPLLVRAARDDTVGEVAERLRRLGGHRDDIDAVVVVDDGGALLDDISLYDLFTASADTTLDELVRDTRPLTVTVDTPVDEVVDEVAANRRTSVVVVDDEGRPVGRILVDDVLDHLLAGPTRRLRRAS